MVADVDALQNLYLRALGPPLVALLAGAVSVGVAAAFLPAAGLVLAAGLLAGGRARCPRWRGGSAAGGRRQAARARRAVGRARRASCAPRRSSSPTAARAAALGRVRAADGALVRLARRDALVGGLADGSGLAVTGVTVAGVLAVAVRRVRRPGTSTAC